MNRSFRWLSSVVALLAVFLIIQQARAANDDSFGMVTGSNTGTYIEFGRNIAKIAKSAGLDILVKNSGGSLDNINRMASKENAALGIVQSDVLGFLARSTDPKSQDIANRLRLVFPFYNEEVHLFAHKDIQGFEDLQGKRVVVGAKNSGNWVTATYLLHKVRIEPGERINLPPAEGILAVLTGEADAMFYVVGKPASAFTNLQKMRKNPEFDRLLGKVHFVPLEHKSMPQGYVAGELGPNDYIWLEEKMPTIAVKAVLVSFDFSRKHKPYYQKRCAQLGKLGKTVRDQLETLKKIGHPKWNEVDLDQRVDTWGLDTCSRGHIVQEPDLTAEEALREGILNIIKGEE